MAEQVTLSAAGNSPAVIGAQILARLAYPDERSAHKRAKVQSKLLLLLGETPTGRRRAGLKHVEALLRHRQAAGNVAFALIAEADGFPIGFPRDFGAPTLRNSIDWLAVTEGMNVRNVEKRIWDKTFPVLNLAAAWCYLMQQQKRSGEVGDVLDMLADAKFLASWLFLANVLGPLIEKRWREKSASCPQSNYAIANPTVQNVTVPP